MAISYIEAVPRLSDPYAARHMRAAKVVGTGLVSSLLEELKEFEVALVTVEEGVLRIVVQVSSAYAMCPGCKQPSSRVHSHYWRTPHDLTAFGVRLVLQVYARRLHCDNPECAQRIFAERLADIPAWARRSDRVTTLLAYTALSAGGLPGKRLAHLYGLHYSRHTLLRAARQLVMEHPKAVQVLGVDDYAQRRGMSYGTLLYDFGEHSVIDLLPGRSADFLAAWLKVHPGIGVISRDRGGIYAEGARKGAPQAIQVADRFHLMQNLGDCLEKVAQQGIRLQAPDPAPDQPTVSEQPDPLSTPPRPPTRPERAKAATRQRRQERQDAVHDLLRQGASIRAIAIALHMQRKAVHRYLKSLPDNARPRQPSICDAYAEHLRRRWNEGVHNVHALYEEIRGQGYPGSESGLRHYLQPWRVALPAASGLPHSQRSTTPKVISPRSFRRLVLKNLRTPAEEGLLARIVASDPSLATSVSLAHDFAATFHNHDVATFDAWLDTASSVGIPEWKTFADGLRRDIDAVHHGITLTWSQGPVEGSINRLKLIKRSMYGRGGHDLLRRRVIFHLPD